MNRCTSLPALVLLLFIGGCAALRPAPPPERDAALHLARGLEALDAGQYVGAFDQLAWVATHCPTHQAGLRARAGLAALELDPRNPVGRPDVGMRLLGDLILGPATPTHLRSFAEVTYLLGLGLGAPAAEAAAPPGTGADATPRPVEGGAGEELPPPSAAQPTADPEPRLPPVHGCGPVLVEADSGQWSLPELPGPSLAAMLAQAEARQRVLMTEAELLQGEAARLREELEQTRAELARIRRTLRP